MNIEKRCSSPPGTVSCMSPLLSTAAAVREVNKAHSAGYCGLVKVAEDDNVLQPTNSPLDQDANVPDGPSTVLSESASQQDALSEPKGSPLGTPPPGMQFAEQNSNQPAAVTAGFSGNDDTAEQLLLKLESLQIAEGLSNAGTHGQKARVAEEAFAEALQALERGNVAAAVNLLKVAQVACPANKPQAQARIILLLGRCQQMTGPAKTAPTPTSAASAALNRVSQSLPPNSHMQEAAGTGSQPRRSTEVDRDNEGDSMKQADQDFQNGLDALNRGDLQSAMQHLQDARKACPRSKSSALVKIQRFINLIEEQDKRTKA